MSGRIGMKSTREAVKQEDRQELGQISEVVQAEMIHKIFKYFIMIRSQMFQKVEYGLPAKI